MDAVLITGASGFLGSHLAAERYAAEPGRPLVLLDNQVATDPRHPVQALRQKANVWFIHADLRDGHSIAQILKDYRVAHIIHAASNSQTGDDPSELLDENVAATLILLEACRVAWLQSDMAARHRFHYISSADILQPNANGTVFDAAPIAPETLYGASKAAAEAFVCGYAHRHRINATISYPTQVYGAGQNASAMIPSLIQSLLDGKRIPMYGNGTLVHDMLHVLDAAKAILAVADRGVAGDRYGIAGSRATLAQILATLSRAIDAAALAVPDFARRFPRCPAASGKPTSSLITMVQDRRSTQRARNYLFNALTTVWPHPERKSIVDGLQETVAWVVADIMETPKTVWARNTA